MSDHAALVCSVCRQSNKYFCAYRANQRAPVCEDCLPNQLNAVIATLENRRPPSDVAPAPSSPVDALVLSSPVDVAPSPPSPVSVDGALDTPPSPVLVDGTLDTPPPVDGAPAPSSPVAVDGGTLDTPPPVASGRRRHDKQRKKHRAKAANTITRWYRALRAKALRAQHAASAIARAASAIARAARRYIVKRLRVVYAEYVTLRECLYHHVSPMHFVVSALEGLASPASDPCVVLRTIDVVLKGRYDMRAFCVSIATSTAGGVEDGLLRVVPTVSTQKFFMRAWSDAFVNARRARPDAHPNDLIDKSARITLACMHRVCDCAFVVAKKPLCDAFACALECALERDDIAALHVICLRRPPCHHTLYTLIAALETRTVDVGAPDPDIAVFVAVERDRQYVFLGDGMAWGLPMALVDQFFAKPALHKRQQKITSRNSMPSEQRPTADTWCEVVASAMHKFIEYHAGKAVADELTMPRAELVESLPGIDAGFFAALAGSPSRVKMKSKKAMRDAKGRARAYNTRPTG